MKLIYIANARIPTEKAHGKQIIETCRALANLGVEVSLILPKRRNHIKENPFVYYGINKIFSIQKIACLDLLWLPTGKQATFIIESITFALSALRYASKRDVLYTRDFIVAAVLNLFGKVVYYEIHTLPDKIKWWHKKIWHRCRGLVVISEGLRKELLWRGVKAEKILVARDGVDIKKYDINISKVEARQKLNLPTAKNIVVYTGHLYPWKGADLLASAAGKLLAEADVHLVGGTAEDVVLFRNRHKAPNLRIAGHRPENEIPLWMKAADILILPNRAEEKISSHYTSPLKLFEYMASGTPIVAADLPSVREVVSENEVKFFKADDAESLVKAIRDVLRLGVGGGEKIEKAKKVVQEYDWNKRAAKILGFLGNN